MHLYFFKYPASPAAVVNKRPVSHCVSLCAPGCVCRMWASVHQCSFAACSCQLHFCLRGLSVCLRGLCLRGRSRRSKKKIVEMRRCKTQAAIQLLVRVYMWRVRVWRKGGAVHWQECCSYLGRGSATVAVLGLTPVLDKAKWFQSNCRNRCSVRTSSCSGWWYSYIVSQDHFK